MQFQGEQRDNYPQFQGEQRNNYPQFQGEQRTTYHQEQRPPTFVVGNTATVRNDGCTWDWTIYIRPAGGCSVQHMRCVRANLLCANNTTWQTVELRNTGSRFEFSGVGWGQYQIPIQIYLHTGAAINTAWNLTFDPYNSDHSATLQC